MSQLFSVVTPSFNMLEYLRRCHQSVADQSRVAVEHIVVDAVSTDGTDVWLRSEPNIVAIVGKDCGMYDAINKGLASARGDIVSYINCDEQYLPGTLSFVREYFESNPRVDVLFGDVLVVDATGGLLSFRKGISPRLLYIRAKHLYLLSCAMFFRRRLIDDGLRFDDQLRGRGDEDFVIHLLEAGYVARHVPRYLAAFTWTGSNLSSSAAAHRENQAAFRGAPLWLKLLRNPINLARLVEKVLNRAYWQAFPIEYAIYAPGSEKRRKRFKAEMGSFRWPRGQSSAAR